MQADKTEPVKNVIARARRGTRRFTLSVIAATVLTIAVVVFVYRPVPFSPQRELDALRANVLRWRTYRGVYIEKQMSYPWRQFRFRGIAGSYWRTDDADGSVDCMDHHDDIFDDGTRLHTIGYPTESLCTTLGLEGPYPESKQVAVAARDVLYHGTPAREIKIHPKEPETVVGRFHTLLFGPDPIPYRWAPDGQPPVTLVFFRKSDGMPLGAKHVSVDIEVRIMQLQTDVPVSPDEFRPPYK